MWAGEKKIYSDSSSKIQLEGSESTSHGELGLVKAKGPAGSTPMILRRPKRNGVADCDAGGNHHDVGWFVDSCWVRKLVLLEQGLRPGHTSILRAEHIHKLDRA
eukprot:CAMPEP_0175808812 /NCGR_PEP_ID=MMETSP0107_2-20121207/2461_1 /TAXON_ID=195067 ORGANISM="Goniomonas pacifica, Strain CCMP1869" /NCGR_SAMPLE_ID=MMETSP0107_2 /ASSEMBLY_ACC=CAM_ASM_000203 /LENGTH=103 /DNA_ID=CAMNT_0017120469 /DNA_START=205 /DNA_END=512 /DNA_ORIENTATION=+